MNADPVRKYFVDKRPLPFAGRAEFYLPAENARYRQQPSARYEQFHQGGFPTNRMARNIPVIYSSLARSGAAPAPKSISVLPVTFIVRKEIWLPDRGELQVIIPKIKSDFVEGQSFKRQSRVTLAVPSAPDDNRYVQKNRRRAASLPKEIHTSNYHFAVSTTTNNNNNHHPYQPIQRQSNGFKKNFVAHRSFTFDPLGERNIISSQPCRNNQPKSILRKHNTARQQHFRTGPVYQKKTVTFM